MLTSNTSSFRPIESIYNPLHSSASTLSHFIRTICNIQGVRAYYHTEGGYLIALIFTPVSFTLEFSTFQPGGTGGKKIRKKEASNHKSKQLASTR